MAPKNGRLEVNWGSVWKAHAISNEAALKLLDPGTASAWAELPMDKWKGEIDQLRRERATNNPVIYYIGLPPSVIQVLLKGFEAAIVDLHHRYKQSDGDDDEDSDYGNDLSDLKGSAEELRRVLSSSSPSQMEQESSPAPTQAEDDQ